TLTFVEATIHLSQGAYMVGGEMAMVDGIYQTLYRCPNTRTRMLAHYTNTGPAVGFRPPGFVEGGFGLESALGWVGGGGGMDELARAMDMDPVELRLKNYATDEQLQEMPYSSPDSLRECYARVTEAFGWPRREQTPKGHACRRGVGFAAHNWIGGAGWPPGY